MKMLISHHHHYQQMKNPQSPVRHQSQVHENYYQSRTSVPDVPDTLPTFKHSFTFNGLGYFESSDAVDTKSSQIFGFIIGFINCDEKWPQCVASVAYRRCSYLRMTCISLWWVAWENTASHVYQSCDIRRALIISTGNIYERPRPLMKAGTKVMLRFG